MTLLDVVTLEADVRRIWGAVRFLDAATARPVEAAVQVSAPGVRWLRNGSALHVVMSVDRPTRAAELAAFEVAFDSVPPVAALRVEAQVVDPGGRYLARRFSVELPRADQPAGRNAPRFLPQDVVLDRAPSAPMLGTWAVLRVAVRRAGRPAPHAAIRVQRSGGGSALGRGMTDERGEALIAVAGIAQVTVGDGELVVEREIDAELVVSFDAAADSRAVPDPDALALDAAALRSTVRRRLASARSEWFEIDLPG